MRCTSCGRENRADAKFCDNCGERLSAPYIAPDVQLAVPAHLAEKIREVQRSLDGERKQVTVMFADVKGSMYLAEDVDPEEWRRILNRFYAILTEGVHRFEGTINQYTGDGIMAIFGAPIAHEDHARRACYSALHLRSTRGICGARRG
jgi:class 3 adenylate cyclase